MSQTEGPALSLSSRPVWRLLPNVDAPLFFPAAHDALSARLIMRAGFSACQFGWFALAAKRHAFPDIDLVEFSEENETIGQSVAAAPLPVIVNAGNGFGDVKNVTRTVRG